MRLKYLLLLFIIVTTIFSTTAQPIIEWQKSLGGSLGDEAYTIEQTLDGGYIVAGRTFSSDGDITINQGGWDCWVVKLNSTGNLIWQKTFGGTGDDYINSIKQTPDGGYIFTGYTNSSDGDLIGNYGFNDCWVVKLTSGGIMSWQKLLGGTSEDYAFSIETTTDGGYIVAGHSNSIDGDLTSNNGQFDFWVVKLTNTGAITWQKSFGGSLMDRAYSIKEAIDGGYIVIGTTSSVDGDITNNNGLSDFWILKLTSSGVIEWQKTLGGSGAENGYSIQQTIDSGYVVAGYSDSNDGNLTVNNGGYDYWVVKLSNNGIIEWQKSLGGSGTDQAITILQTSEGGYVVAGRSSSNNGDILDNNGGYDYWIVKLTNSGSIAWKKSLGGSFGDWGHSIQQTVDAGYVIAGRSISNDGDVTGNNGAYDFWIVKLSSSLGIHETSIPKNPKLLPNPTSTHFTIKGLDELYNLTIYNAVGQLLYQENVNEQNKQVDVSNYAKGILFIRIEVADEVIYRKVIKQ
jgi:Secretion system C-terminal sorting domain